MDEKTKTRVVSELDFEPIKRIFDSPAEKIPDIPDRFALCGNCILCGRWRIQGSFVSGC